MDRVVRVGVAGLLLGASVASGAVAAPNVAGAEPGDGTVTVQVLRDVVGDGVDGRDALPQVGMTVTVSDAAGHQVRATTDATGKVVVPSSADLVGGRYRVDVTIPAPYDTYLRAAPASAAAGDLASATSFVDVRGGKDVSVKTAVWNPADFTGSDSPYLVARQVPAIGRDGTPTAPNDPALVSLPRAFPAACSGDEGCPTTLATQAQVGTTFGLTFDRYRQRILQSAFARRFTDYGPGGGGAIYSTPLGGGAPQLFATVRGATLTPHVGDLRKDATYIDVPGKESLGGIALSDDGTTLYAVNLLTQQLVSFDATGASAGATKATVPIPDPGCAASTDWRPFALTYHDAALYVGGVCTAESTQNRADLKVVVYRYDGAAFTPVVTHRLDYQRGSAYTASSADQVDQWNPWSADAANWGQYDVGGAFVDPQPELASMAFDRNGDLILGFRDRFADVVGSGGFDPRPGNNTVDNGSSGGDITMACAKTGGGYAWEGEPECPVFSDPGIDGQQADGVVEFFYGDYVPVAGGGKSPVQEAAQGSVAYKPRPGELVSTELDPVGGADAGGLGLYDAEHGEGPGGGGERGYQFVSAQDDGFASAGSLGGLAYASAAAPVQLGNRVWFDADHDGLQEPDEPAIPGAAVTLLDAQGQQVATATTNADGEYYFGGAGASYQLARGARYTVRYDACDADTSGLPGGPSASGLRFTSPRAGNDPVSDSDVTPPTSGSRCAGTTSVTAPTDPGTADVTVDAGLYAPTAPTVGTQPADQTVTVGETATFSAEASGDPTPTVQWQRSTDGGKTFTDIDGATEATYTTPKTVDGDNGSQYRAVFGNDADSVTTDAATLTVQIPPAFTTGSDLPDGTVGQKYSTTITDTGRPAPTDKVTNGAVPPGLALSGDPMLSGTPTKAGTFRFTLTATNAAGIATRTFTLTVAAATSSSSPATSPPAPSTGPSSAASPAGGSSEGLANTGVDIAWLTLAAAIAGATGVFLLLAARRRRDLARHRA